MIPLVYREHLEYVGAVGILAIIYFVCAKFGLAIAYVHPSATTVWAPTGIALVALLLLGYRYAPGIFAGAFAANVTTAGTVFTSLGIATGNTLEAVVFTFLVLTFASGVRAFERAQSVFAFIISALFATTISASFGIASLYLGGFAAREQLGAIWLTWWLGDVGGALLVAPFILMWWNHFWVEWTLLETAEILAIVGTIVGTAYVVFGPVNFAFDFLVAPVLVWLIMRFSTREALSGMLLLLALAVGGTLNGYGPFALYPAGESLLYLQAFIVVATMSVLVLSAIVSERRSAESALVKADRAKDDFLTALSHELRNPLSSIVSHLQLLEFSPRSVEDTKILHTIRVELRHTTALLEDLLDLARVRRGRMILHQDYVDLANVAKEVSESFRPIMSERGHTFEIQAGQRPLWIHGDRSRIKQIVVNLLSNASKYTDRGAIRIACHQLGMRAIVSVTDSGIGIAPDRLVRLLGTDIPAPEAMRHSRGGLGIGLALVKRLADMHYASLKIESEGEGKGSTFSVSFPRVPDEEVIKTTKPILLPASAKDRPVSRSILIVDDNRKAAEALAALLQKLGHSTHVLYDGTSALRRVTSHQTDVVLLDLALPDISGFEVAEKVQTMPLTRKPLLIALSGYGSEDDINRSREVGFAHHLLKPVEIAELQSVLKHS